MRRDEGKGVLEEGEAEEGREVGIEGEGLWRGKWKVW